MSACRLDPSMSLRIPAAPFAVASCALTFFTAAVSASICFSNRSTLHCSSRKARCSLRNSLEQHRVDGFVAHRERFSFLVGQHQRWIYLCDFLGNQTKLWCAVVVRLL